MNWKEAQNEVLKVEAEKEMGEADGEYISCTA
jgi:hypothetical protein